MFNENKLFIGIVSIVVLAVLVLTLTGNGLSGFAYSGKGTGPFDYNLSLNESSLFVEPGGSVTAILTATLLSGKTKPITFYCSGLPNGTSCSFTPSTCSPACSTLLNITVSPTTPFGTYEIIIDATYEKKAQEKAYGQKKHVNINVQEKKKPRPGQNTTR